VLCFYCFHYTIIDFNKTPKSIAKLKFLNITFDKIPLMIL